MDVTTRLAELRAQQQAWATFTPRAQYEVSADSADWGLVQGIYYDSDRLDERTDSPPRFLTRPISSLLPSPVTPIYRLGEQIHFEGINIGICELDPSQDLIVFQDKNTTKRQSNIVLSIRALSSTGLAPHPLAFSSTFRFRHPLGESPLDLQSVGIFDDIIWLLIMSGDQNSRLVVVWNWKSGRVLAVHAPPSHLTSVPTHQTFS